MQCLHTLREATQQNTNTNTAYRRAPHSEYNSRTTQFLMHATRRTRGVYFSLHSRPALCPLPSAFSSYQVALVSSEATDVPIPLFPGLASQACKTPASNRLPECPVVLLDQTGSPAGSGLTHPDFPLTESTNLEHLQTCSGPNPLLLENLG